MSATFAKIGNTTMVLDSIRDLQIRRKTGSPINTTRYGLHINNRSTPCYSGSWEECEQLREVILETLHTYFNVDVVDLGEGIIRDGPEESDGLGEDSDAYVGL